MSLSDVSSLSDLTSDEETYVPSKGKGKKEAKQYQIKPILRAPRSTTYSAKALYDQIVENSIDLNPEYQRDVVWGDAKQTGLIDSLLRNFSIPPVIFALREGPDGIERRTCIDGKQRLTSILRFMDGQIPHKDSRTNAKHWYKLTNTNKSGKLLPQGYRQQFANKQILCVEYQDLNDDSEREIFQRVQLGVALTPAERMQAVSTPWASLVRDCVKYVEQSISSKMDWTSSRGRDFQCVASVIYVIEKQAITFSSVATLEKWMQRSTPPKDDFKEKIFDTITVFGVLLDDKNNEKTFTKPAKVSPVEFIMILFLINSFMHLSSLQQLNTAIAKMRQDVRAQHTDIRNNPKVIKTMMSFINARLPADLKRTPGITALKAAKDVVAARPKAVKRKRKEVSSESSNEEDVPLRTQSPLKKATRTVSGVSASTTKAAERTASSSSLAKQESVRRSGTPSSVGTSSTKTHPDQHNTQPTTNGRVPNGPSTAPREKDRLAAIREAREKASGMSRAGGSGSPQTVLPATQSTIARVPSRLSLNMGPPSSTGGANALHSGTPGQMPPSAGPPQPSTAPPGSGLPLINIGLEDLNKVQVAVRNATMASSPTASQMSATQWPVQPAQLQQAIQQLTQQNNSHPQHQGPNNAIPPPPHSAALADPRSRAVPNAPLPVRPSFDAFDQHATVSAPPPHSATPSTVRSFSRRGSSEVGNANASQSSAPGMSTEDERMDRPRNSRFDSSYSRGHPPSSSTMSSSGGYRDRPGNPNSTPYPTGPRGRGSEQRPPNPSQYSNSNPNYHNGVVRERDNGWGSRSNGRP